MAFNNVLRTSSLAGVVDFQRAALGFGAMLEQSDGVLHLGQLQDFLLEQGGPAAGVTEVIVFLKSREARFGLQMELPPELAALSDDERNAIVQAFTTRGATSGTRAGRTPSGVTGSVGVRTQSNPVVVPGSVEMPSSRSGSFRPPEPHFGTPAKNTRALKMGLLALLMVVGVGNAVWLYTNRAAPVQSLTLNDPAGLPCVSMLATGDVVVCELHKSDGAMPKEAFEARGSISQNLLKARGFKRLIVKTIEDDRVLRIF